MPQPSQAAVNRKPSDPSHAAFRTSRINVSTSDSPTGSAEVIMYEVMPLPDPKCLRPLNRHPPAPSGRAIASDLLVSPPVPGSETIVPHQPPSRAAANPQLRCSCQEES